VGVFTATELKLDTHFVALIEKFFAVSQFGFVIVLADVHAELDFLKLAGGLLLLFVLLGNLVLELSEIYDSTNGWYGGGRDLDEV